MNCIHIRSSPDLGLGCGLPIVPSSSLLPYPGLLTRPFDCFQSNLVDEALGGSRNLTVSQLESVHTNTHTHTLPERVRPKPLAVIQFHSLSRRYCDPPKVVTFLFESPDPVSQRTKLFGIKRVIVTPAVYPRLVEFLHFDIQSTGQKSQSVNIVFRPSLCFVLIKQSDSPCPLQF